MRGVFLYFVTVPYGVSLLDLTIEHGLPLVQVQQTRDTNLLDLVFTNNPSIVKTSSSVPGISDHAMVVTDIDIIPQHVKQKPGKLFIFSKANWDNISLEWTGSPMRSPVLLLLPQWKTYGTPLKEKAQLLVKQFQSVFTYDDDQQLPDTKKRARRPISPLHINTNGVEKLLRGINTAKAQGPDQIANVMLKTCASQLAPALRNIF